MARCPTCHGAGIIDNMPCPNEDCHAGMVSCCEGGTPKIVSLAEKILPAVYSITVIHHYGGQLECTIHDLDCSNSRSLRSARSALQGAIEMLDEKIKQMTYLQPDNDDAT